ncbi:uncharacterized protein LOC130667167 [Microplitis mediator]|uniref:uncharacterized protein LOC130667167 n=1 Tax=Microplitis mediator TaxID=375433 RepID=UPI0025577860|nr:uncharacterized protein LOC130667167 [Microplitis mediator]
MIHISQLSTAHCVCAQIVGPGISLYVVLSYFQCRDEIKIDITQLEKVAQTLRGNSVLFGMDANARSIRWGPKTNEKGEKLEDFIDDYGLEVLNIKREGPTYALTSGESYIDVTLATPKLAWYVRNWPIKREWVQSTDHYAIDISLGIPRDREGLGGVDPKRFNLALADWEKFRVNLPELTRANLEDLALETVEDLEKYTNALTKTIMESCEFAIPRKKAHVKSYPW